MSFTVNKSVARAISGLFGSEKDADCTIVFCLEEPSCPLRQSPPLDDLGAEVDEAPAKRQKLEDGSSAALSCGTVVVGDPLPAHQFVLRYASERFSVQIERWGNQRVPLLKSSPDASEEECAEGLHLALSNGRPELRITLGSEGELAGAHAAIRYAYTGQVHAGSIREALEVRRQAAYLQIDECATACDEVVREKLEAASQRSSAAGTCTAIIDASPAAGASADKLPPVLELYTNEALWPDPDEDPSFAAVLSAAKPQLVSYFNNAISVLNTPLLRQQLLKLPSAAVYALLESSAFGTDSESSILLMLATWMKKNYAKADATMRERLCRQVRLVQLSKPYLGFVLPALVLDYETGAQAPAGWLAVNGMEAAFISNLARASPVEREQLETAGSGMFGLKTPAYSITPRPQCLPEAGLTFHWHVTQEQLEQKLGQLRREHVYPSFDGGKAHIVARGFLWRPSLKYTVGQAAAGLFLWCNMSSAFEVAESRLGDESKLAAVVEFDAHLAVHKWQDGVRRTVQYSYSSSEDMVTIGRGRGWSKVLPLRPTTADSH
ncbi:hypothetical protein Agub_g9688, partial [Astrephomene gubernaculifera]